MEGGHLKRLIVVVCERWVAIGYFSRIKGLVQYHTKLCPFPFSLSLSFCSLVKILGQNLRIFHIFLKVVLQF